MSDTGLMTDSLAKVHIASLGCARNDVDSEELAGRLAAEGFELVTDPADAATVVVNTCGFIEQAKKDSIDTILSAADLKADGVTKAVVAVGCLAERYGAQLAAELPEADAVLGFDDYPDMAARLRGVLAGERPAAHEPTDRRKLLPLSPSARPVAASQLAIPGHLKPASGPVTPRLRLSGAPSAPLKIASGCDRRCAFCAIPSFRGAYLSRDIPELLDEARWLIENGVKELFLVSENTSSYGKDLGLDRDLERLLTELATLDGLEWLRVSYLQPAEIRPSLIEAMTAIDKVVPYFDLSFQHAAPDVLRRMRRFGGPESFLALIEQIRALNPDAGIRSNVITGFPGETDTDVAILQDFIIEAKLDVLGVFGYSDEDGTEAAELGEKVDPAEVAERQALLSEIAEQVSSERAEDRIGESGSVLIEERIEDALVGRAAHQAPESDGIVRLLETECEPGDLVSVRFIGSEGIDLIGELA